MLDQPAKGSDPEEVGAAEIGGVDGERRDQDLAGVVTKSCSNLSTAIPKKMKEVVSAAVTAEDRSHNVVIFVATEEED